MIGQSGAAWMDADDEDANARVRACVRECRTRARSEWTRSFARSFRFESSRVACSSMAMTTSTTTTAMRMRMRESTTIRGRRAVVVSGRAGTTRRARGRDVEVRDDAMRTVCGGGWVGARGGEWDARHSFIHSFNSLSGNAHLSNRSIVAARLGRMDRVTRASRGCG
jgi:hypothetical protein